MGGGRVHVIQIQCEPSAPQLSRRLIRRCLGNAGVSRAQEARLEHELPETLLGLSVRSILLDGCDPDMTSNEY